MGGIGQPSASRLSYRLSCRGISLRWYSPFGGELSLRSLAFLRNLLWSMTMMKLRKFEMEEGKRIDGMRGRSAMAVGASALQRAPLPQAITITAGSGYLDGQFVPSSFSSILLPILAQEVFLSSSHSLHALCVSFLSQQSAFISLLSALVHHGVPQPTIGRPHSALTTSRRFVPCSPMLANRQRLDR